MPYLRVFGIFAIAAGLARIASSFIDWRESGGALEAFALAIDLGLLFGLTGFWLAHAKELGPFGLAAYLVAASGIALITGPDGTAYGVDVYETGVTIIGLGLAFLGAVILARGVDARLGAIAWLLAVAASVGGGAIGKPEEGFMAAGIIFGAGFVFAGMTVLAKRGA